MGFDDQQRDAVAAPPGGFVGGADDRVGADPWFVLPGMGNSSPLIAHVPHAGVEIPKRERAGLLLDDQQLAAELLVSTDHHTLGLARGAIELGGSIMAMGLSRLVVDVERFTDDAVESQAAVGRGAVYLKTSGGDPLREPDAGERERLLHRYFRPYHAGFEALVERTLELHDRCLIIDVHSYPSVPPPYELDPDGPRPGICLGTDGFHTPGGLAEAVEATVREAGVPVARDRPFAGTFVPLPHYRSDRRVSSVMLEIRRDLYMDEASGAAGEGFDATCRLVRALMEAAIETVR